MANLQITVLMTVYNPGPYFQPALQSVLGQTHRNFELLIIDDASTDGVLAASGASADPRVRIHRNAVNMGQTRSLNVGLQLARGEWIARMDADDMALPQWLERQSTFAASQKPATAVISTRAAVIDEHNRLLRVLNTPVSEEEIRMKSLWASPINHVGSLMRRSELVKAGGYDENFKIAADYDLWARLLNRGLTLAVCPQVSVLIRIHEKSLSVTNRSQREIPEVKDVVTRRIADEAGRRMTPEEADLWLKGHYSPAELDERQFQDLQALVREVLKDPSQSRPLLATLQGKRLLTRRWAPAVLYRFWSRQTARQALKEDLAQLRKCGVSV